MRSCPLLNLRRLHVTPAPFFSLSNPLCLGRDQAYYVPDQGLKTEMPPQGGPHGKASQFAIKYLSKPYTEPQLREAGSLCPREFSVQG
jgi:hypothetical protein